MQLGEPRKAEETRQQLYENLNLSNGLGNETRIGDIMTKTGVKDTFQLHFIEWMQETYKKVGAAERKKALDESWKELQELQNGKHRNLAEGFHRKWETQKLQNLF